MESMTPKHGRASAKMYVGGSSLDGIALKQTINTGIDVRSISIFPVGYPGAFGASPG